MNGIKCLPFVTAVFLITLLGVIPLKAQDYKKCVLIQTSSGEKVEYYISSNPRLTQDNDKVTLTTDNSTIEFTTDNILKVYVSEANYKLEYILDGEVYRTYYHHPDVSIPIEPNPTAVDGYKFSGWSQTLNTMPARDVTVTGTFSLQKYNILYKVDGEVYQSMEVEYGSSITPLPFPEKEGFSFSGWSEIPSTMPAHDIIVTGSFTKGNYKLTYMVDGETYKIMNIDYGSTITPEEMPTKEGYTFSGWSEIPETMPAQDVTITGSFTINHYTITYVIDNEIYFTETKAFGAEIVPPNVTSREGYDFAWESYPRMMPARDVTVNGVFTQMTGIDAAQAENSMSMNGDYINLSGLQSGDCVNIYNISGKVMQSYRASATGHLSISIATLPHGVYIIKTSHQTFKITRR